MSSTVMVVDDDTLVGRSLARALANGGFQTVSANDGAEALVLAAKTRPDIAVLDYNMPTSGIEVTRGLRASYGSAVFIVVLTGDDDDEVRAACLAAGADAVMTKPVSPSELRYRLTNAMQAADVVSVAS